MIRDDRKYDFYIVTMPRSGSHMLASAINSHPDLQCGGEKGFIDEPKLPNEPCVARGCITHIKAYNVDQVSLDDVSKVIVLLRHDNRMLLNYTRNKVKLVLTYEGLTKDKNIDQLPKAASRLICDFLGVKHVRMTPTMKKNKVAA